MSSNMTATVTFADRCFKLSRFIHWMTVALLSGLLVTALLWNIDPHGSGNTAFLWHSSLGISVYLLSMARVLLWLVYRPTRRGADNQEAQVGRPGLRYIFYGLLLALPFSGWILASEEGMPAHLFGLPALPQWYERAAPSPIGSADKPKLLTTRDTTSVIYVNRVHAALAAALSSVIVVHIFTVIQARRRDQRRRGMSKQGEAPSAKR